MLPEHSFEKVGLLIRTPKFRRNRELFRQMERAAISVHSNFAEGFERDLECGVRDNLNGLNWRTESSIDL